MDVAIGRRGIVVMVCRAISSVCCDEMSDGGWGAGDVKPSNAVLDGTITDRDVLMLS